MNIAEKIKNKAIGYYIGLAASILGIVLLIIFAVYSGKNGSTSAWVYVTLIAAFLLEVIMLFTDEKIADIIAILPPFLFMIATTETLHTGVGNIVDALQGIVMFGDSTLSGTNYTMAVIGLICVLFGIVAAFMKKNRDAD